MRSFRLPILACLVLAVPAISQIKKPGNTPAPTPTVKKAITPVGEVKILRASEANIMKARLNKFVLSKKAIRSAHRLNRKKAKTQEEPRGLGARSGSFLTQLEEVEAAGRVQHASLVPVLKKIMLHGGIVDAVKIKAANSLQAQPKKAACKVAMELLRDTRFQEQGSLSAPMIRLMSHHGAPKKFWAYMRRRFLTLGTLGQQALLEHIGSSRDWDSARLLLENIDQPSPADVDAADNPPAEYWKKRYDKWARCKPQVRNACEKLFGQSFTTRKEANAWLAKRGGLNKLRKKRGG
jgi:hypothetical protein